MIAGMVNWKQNLLFIWLSQFFSITGFCLALPFAPFYIQQLGITDPTAIKFWTGLSAAAPAVGLAIMSPVWGLLSDRFGRKLMTLCAAGMDPIFFSWLSRVTPEEKRGTVFGWAVTAKSIGWAITPLVSAAVAVEFGTRAVFLTGGVLFMLLVPVISWVARSLSKVTCSASIKEE